MGLQIVNPPAAEPVSLASAKTHLRVSFTDPTNDTLIEEYIQAARELAEAFTGRSFISKGYVQVLDNFPQYTDSIFSQSAFPPDYYAQGRYTSNFWNYSQQIKLLRSPLLKVDRIDYVLDKTGAVRSLYAIAERWLRLTEYVIGDRALDSNGNVQEAIGATEGEESGASLSAATEPTWNVTTGLNTTDADITWKNLGPASGFADFLIDRFSAPARLFPPAGSYWPGAFYVPNAVRIYFTAGYGQDDANVPAVVKTAIKQLVANFYAFREPVSALLLRDIPHHFSQLLESEKIYDYSPMR